MIGSLIGAGVNLVGSIFGGMKASKAMKNVRRNIESQRAHNEAWYNRYVNEDVTERADARRLLTETREMLRRRNDEAEGRRAVSGGTEESVAAERAANNAALADVASRIAATGDSRRNAVEVQYLQRDNALTEQENALETGKAGALSQAVGVLGQAAGGLGEALDGLGRKKEGVTA